MWAVFKTLGWLFDIGDYFLAMIRIPINESLGGGFKDFLFFTPKLGEDEPILTSIFFKWVETNHQLDKIW